MNPRAAVDLVRERDDAGPLVMKGDEHRRRVNDRPDTFADELDDPVELELLSECLADLVDKGELGVPLARLLDRADAAESGADVLADERKEVEVALLVPLVRGVALDDEDAEVPAFRRERHAQPRAVLRDDAELLDLAGGLQLPERRAVETKRSTQSQRVGRDAASLTLAERLPGLWVGRVVVQGVDVVRVVHAPALGVVQRDVEVVGEHQLSDDRVDVPVERLQVAGGARRLGDPIERRLDLLSAGVLRLAGFELGNARRERAHLVDGYGRGSGNGRRTLRGHAAPDFAATVPASAVLPRG
jgi:hypothetical protein